MLFNKDNDHGIVPQLTLFGGVVVLAVSTFGYLDFRNKMIQTPEGATFLPGVSMREFAAEFTKLVKPSSEVENAEAQKVRQSQQVSNVR